jgi:hypothetical protein
LHRHHEEFSLDSHYSKKSCFLKAGATSILALTTLILGTATLPTPSALAQNISVNGGSIQGTITDASGASIANASVIVANKETGSSRTLTTDAAGYYSIGPLNPGNYQVTVTAPGFQKTVVETVIRTGTATPGSFKLAVGQSSEQVTVNAGAVQVNTDQPGVSGVITSEQIKTLPINGRNFLDLAQLEPGVQLESGESFDPTKAGFSALAVNGVSGRTTRILLDGQDITDENVGTTIFNVAQGAIGEFQINHSTQDVSGELTSTGQVLVSTGSGTNAFHGQLFYNFQDHGAGFATIQGIDPPFQRNQFGGSIGGPILKDKLFFFADSERIKQDSSAAASLGSTFSGIQSQFPLLASPYRETYSTGRLDYNGPFGGHYFARVSYDNNSVSSNAGYTYSTYANRDNTPGIAGGVDFATGRFTHSFRVSYEKFHNMIADQSVGNPSLYNPFSASPVFLVDSAQNLFAGPNLLAPQQTYQSDKQFRYDGAWTHGAHNLRYGVGFNRLLGGGLASFYGLAPELSINSSTAPADAALIGDPTQYTTHLVVLGNGQGFFSEKPAFGLPAGGQSDWRFNAYITDSWRLTPKLSVSAGLRYGRDTLRANQDLGVIPCSNIDTSIFPNPPCTGSTPLLDQFAPGLGKQVNQPNLNFAPQIGFVYSPDSKTSIRGGFGVYYDSNVWNNILFDRVNRLQKGLFNDTSNIVRCPTANPVNFPGGVSVNSVNGVSFSQLCSEPISQAAPQWSALQQQYQAAVTAAGPALNPAYVGETLTVNSAFYAPNYVSPYSLQMNLGVQRELTPGTVLSVDFIHSATLKIQQTVDVNHDGAARFLNVPAAQAAISATLTACGVSSVDEAIASCPGIYAPGVGATIVDFAGNGLDSGNNYLSGHPYTGQGLPQAAFGGANTQVGEGLFNFPSGRSGYDALQVNLRHQKTHPFPGFAAANFEASYSFSRIVTTSKGGSDGFFTNYAWNYDNATQFIGRANLDATHQLSFGGSFLMKYGPRIGLIGHFRSANPNDIQLDNLGYDSVFTTDVDGDGSTADLLPGTNPGDFMHSVKPSNLTQKLTAYNSQFAGTPTPAGQALVSAGLLTPGQLNSLGAVQQPVYTGAAKIFNNPMFKSIDASVSYPIRLKWLGEGRSLEPSVSMYNVGNLANWTGFTNATSNFAINQSDAGPDGSGASTYINGDVSGSNYYALKNQNRIQRGSGTYDQGAPRTTEWSLKFNF